MLQPPILRLKGSSRKLDEIAGELGVYGIVDRNFRWQGASVSSQNRTHSAPQAHRLPRPSSLSAASLSCSENYLIVATGSTRAYLGHEEWAQAAPGLRALDDALSILRRVLLAFEAAEMESDQEQVLLHRLLPPNFHDTILTIAMSILDQACEQCSRRFRSCSWMPASIPPSPQPAAGMRSLPDAGRSRPELVPDRP